MLKYSSVSILLIVILCSPFNTIYGSEKLEHQLAIINSGRFVSEDHITVARFQSLLRQLSSKYIENRQQIADMSVTAQKLLKKNGINESLLNIMEGLNKLITYTAKNQKYAEHAASYVTLRDSGQSHTDAILNFKALLNTLGVF